MRFKGPQNVSAGFVDMQEQFWLMRLLGPENCIRRFCGQANTIFDQAPKMHPQACECRQAGKGRIWRKQ